MKRIITILFFIVLSCDTYCIVTENQTLRMIFKPFLMPLIASIYLVSVKKVNFFYISSLFFAFWGDVLLLFKDYFVLGLASFLLSHIFYIVIISKFIQKKSIGIFIKSILPFLLYFGGIVYLIYPKLGDFLIPVLVYGLVISVFGTVAFVNYKQDKTKINLLLLLGAFLFIISDSFIAINQFYKQSIVFEVLIMVLYGISQYLICNFMIVKLNLKAQKK